MTSRLVDSFSRSIEYLRLSVIEQCNLRCVYCRPSRAADGRARHGSLGPAAVRARSNLCPASEILQRVRAHAAEELIPLKPAPGAGPARCYQIGASAASVGVISAISRHFCATCNRVRLTAQGQLLLCLGHEPQVDLGKLLDAGCDDAELERCIRLAIAQKPYGHHFALARGATSHPMSSIGG